MGKGFPVLAAVAALLWVGARPVAAKAEPVARIVSLSPSATEILFALGAADRVVGVSRHCDYPVAAKLKPRVGDFNRPDLEAVRATTPDLVLFTEYVRAEDLAALAEAGLRTLVLAAGSLADVAAAVRTLGELAGRAQAAGELARKLEASVDRVRRRVEAIPEAQRPRVYVEVDGPHELYAVGPGSFMGDAVRAAGGRNAFDHGPAPYFRVTAAEVAEANPDVILIDHPFQYKGGVSKRPGWGRIEAVRRGRVYDGQDFDIILLNRPGPRVARSLEEISRLLHPEAWDGD